MSAHITHDELPQPDDPAASTLIASMNQASVFGHPVRDIRLIETHISWILLTGEFAYKIKKPVDFGFLDFSTLEKRRFYCNQELSLNRRFAPRIYLDVVEIRGSLARPRIDGPGDIVEYAVKMREFAQSCLLSSYAENQRLNADIVDAIADTISDIHAHSECADFESGYGSAAQVRHWSDENIEHIAAAIPTAYLPQSLLQLKHWYRQNPHLLCLVELRRREGRVRDCHGDLHLGNMALIDDRITLFDCIEFNPELRWIDTLSEAAFVIMDLCARGYSGYGWRFLNRYLERNGDYGTLALLRYYFIYRALVRAKVEALRIEQACDPNDDYAAHLSPALRYLELAADWAARQRAGLIIMHGLSGSGKSTVAAALVEALGAIRIRSDVERKRLFGFDASAATNSKLDQGIYTAAATAATYRRLAELATQLLAADFTVIVDATFLRQSERQALLGIGAIGSFSKLIIDCQAPPAELRKRIAAREGDASEANLEVLEQQLASCEPITAKETTRASRVTVGPGGLDQAGIDAIGKLLFG